MKRHPFVCSKCGARYMLQAWKAECPSCGAGYTLVQLPEKPSARSTFVQRLAGLSLFTYVLHGLFGQNLLTFLQFPPPIVFQFAALVVAGLSALGSTPVLAVSLMLGIAAAIFHSFDITPFSVLGLALAVLTAASSAVALYRLSMFSKNRAREVDARSMPEYSGWGGSQQTG
ncbi:MAG: hypothetical protein NZ921_01700 [Candidatus Caldarchaeum sp.]|nr:hypothetical protein [Candidatus Caldarchaeum sp.]MCS7133502.1 hypothetical protein [Candidatus Caldarchaeum sp.]MCX8200692.1 hypothetical protein [Candidatus Caldarchaeum sp.]MDW8435777.1 hypothetical protein [Candidatus Caldarchaeum sp.]